MMAPEKREAKPFLKWVGGKRQLIPELMKHVERAGEFRRYHEPFLGGGALFFELAARGRLGDKYTPGLYDINNDLLNAFRVVRDAVENLIDLLEFHAEKNCEDYYYVVRESEPIIPLHRAARFIYLNRTCFNGLYRVNKSGKFNVGWGKYKKPTICDADNLRAASRVIRYGSLEHWNFTASHTNAKKNDLVYLDPPYHPLSPTANFTAFTKAGFGPRDQARLASVVDELTERGVKVILSNSCTPFITTLYTGYKIHEVNARRNVSCKGDGRGVVKEVIITNF